MVVYHSKRLNIPEGHIAILSPSYLHHIPVISCDIHKLGRLLELQFNLYVEIFPWSYRGPTAQRTWTLNFPGHSTRQLQCEYPTNRHYFIVESHDLLVNPINHISYPVTPMKSIVFRPATWPGPGPVSS